MRYFLFVLLLATRFSWAQALPSGSANLPQTNNWIRIEQIQTDAEVVALVRAIDGDVSYRYCQGSLLIQARYNPGQAPGVAAKKSWEKLDVNQDGQPDLLIYGFCRYYGPICLINRGKLPRS